MAELTARMRAHLQRRHQPDTPQRQIAFDGGRLAVDLDGQRVVRDGQDVHLSPTEFAGLLAYLAVNAGRVIPHKELITQVWGADGARLGPCLRSTSTGCEQKIEADATHPRCLVSRHGTGFAFQGTPVRPPTQGHGVKRLGPWWGRRWPSTFPWLSPNWGAPPDLRRGRLRPRAAPPPWLPP